jgi:hypothetical protein
MTTPSNPDQKGSTGTFQDGMSADDHAEQISKTESSEGESRAEEDKESMGKA